MSFASLVGVALTLAFVLALLAITMRVLRKVSHGTPLGRAKGGVQLEVVQRIALGPRQGIAVVRIGGQLVAVSVGEGGVRAIAELDAEDASVPAATREALSGPISAAPAGPSRDFRAALMHGLRSAGLPLLLLAGVSLAASPRVSSAQASPPPPAGAPTRQGAAPRRADASAGHGRAPQGTGAQATGAQAARRHARRDGEGARRDERARGVPPGRAPPRRRRARRSRGPRRARFPRRPPARRSTTR